MKNIEISVVIPMYNRAKTIERCIRSVLNQTYCPKEIIVVDDGSTDNSVEIVKGMKCKEIKLYKQYHKGAQAARNLGISNAESEWIAFLDSDDEWVPEKLEKQVGYINEDDEDVLIYSTGYEKEGDHVGLIPSFKVSGYAYKKALRNSLVLFPTIFVRKSTLIKIGMLDENVPSFQEWDTSIRLAKVCRLIYIDEALFYWNREDSASTISGNYEKHIAGREYIIKKHRKDMIRYGTYWYIKKQYKILFKYCWENNDDRKWKYLRKWLLF